MILCQDLSRYMLKNSGLSEEEQELDESVPVALSLSGDIVFRVLPPVALGKGTLSEILFIFPAG